MNQSRRHFLFKLFAALFIGAAIFHVINLFYKPNEFPGWRHLLFILIAWVCVYGFIKRPRYFVFLFCILVIQQYYSHGSSLINSWMHEHKTDWISLGVLIFLPFPLMLLIQYYRNNR
jgi:hypothetical protein